MGPPGEPMEGVGDVLGCGFVTPALPVEAFGLLVPAPAVFGAAGVAGMLAVDDGSAATGAAGDPVVPGDPTGSLGAELLVSVEAVVCGGAAEDTPGSAA